MVATRGSSVFMLHPHSLSSIENQASSSSYLVDESKDDGNDRDLMQSAFSLNYSSNSGIGFIWRFTSLSFLSRLAPIWLFKSYNGCLNLTLHMNM